MARARRSGGKKIDFVEWTGLSGAVLAIGANGQAVTTVATAAASATLLRSRGEIVASIDGPTDGDHCAVACGLIVVTEEQVAVGTTAIPNAAADLNADWLWHGFLLLHSQGVTELSGNVTMADRLTIDSKAMRLMRPTNSVVFAVTNSTLAGTPAVDVTVSARQLFGF